MSAREIRWLAVAVALLLAGLNAAASASSQEEPLEAIRSTTEAVLAALNHEPALRTDPAHLERLAEQHAAPRFDFIALARLTLGKHWRTANPEQKARFTEAFHQLLVRTYSVSFGEYTDEQVEYQLLKQSKDGREAAVRSRILSSGRSPIVVDYRLYDSTGAWKIYDVSIEGISLVSNYRTSFSEEIRRYGLDSLIAKLAARNGVQP